MTVSNKTIEYARTAGSLAHFFNDAERLPFLRGMTWAMIGSIYGLVYVLLRNWTPGEAIPLAHSIIPPMIATAFVALLYGSMRLTVIVGIYASVAIAIAFLVAELPTNFDLLIGAGTLTGVFAGAIYGWRVKNSRVFRVDAKIIAGACAGILASISNVIPSLLDIPLPLHLELLLVAPLSGLLYLGLAPYCVGRLSNILPATLDGAVVGGGVGLLMATLFWMMSGTLEGYLGPSDQTLVNHLTEQLPIGVISAACGGFTVGVSRALMKIRWYNL